MVAGQFAKTTADVLVHLLLTPAKAFYSDQQNNKGQHSGCNLGTASQTAHTLPHIKERRCHGLYSKEIHGPEIVKRFHQSQSHTDSNCRPSSR